jgi:hypothetical protein
MTEIILVRACQCIWMDGEQIYGGLPYVERHQDK